MIGLKVLSQLVCLLCNFIIKEMMSKYFIILLFLLIAFSSSLCKASDSKEEFLLKAADAAAKHNYQAAFKYYKKAAELGNLDAMCLLAMTYRDGRGVPKNYQEAFKWYKKGVNPSDFDAILPFFDEVGRLKGIKGNFDAMAKHSDLFFRILNLKCLGDLYYKGEGTHQDYREAFRCWKKAVQLGDDSAMCRLGIAYYKGEGVLKDPKQAKYWVEKASDVDVSESAYAACLGYGRPKDAWNKLELWKY
jgi:TPR repeat protein